MKLKVFYRGQLVGMLADDPTRLDHILFEYDGGWIAGGLELSPFRLPLQPHVQENHNPIFYNLPGLFYDSLPDAWGMSTLERYFMTQGKLPQEIPTLAKLAYIGQRGMGALTYQPAMEIKDDAAIMDALNLAKMDREAHKILVGSGKTILPELAAASSAGGARPKVVMAMRGKEIVHGTVTIPDGFTGWLVKLAALKRGTADTGQYGRLEYAYSLMAEEAGITMPETQLLNVSIHGRKVGLFAAKRFDRIPGIGEKQRRHIQTLAALQHMDFTAPLDVSELLNTTWEITKDIRQVREAFRRVVFNVASCNCDDHAKNFSFLMDEQGRWTLTPAYDLTYSLGQGHRAVHAMRVNGTATPGRADLMAAASECSLGNGAEILDQVHEAVAQWPMHAKKAGVTSERAKEIGRRIWENGLRQVEGRRQKVSKPCWRHSAR
ncbi:MAG: type II toxin-antitoxin system HipA family toxin [Verrucomicrobia bacterium]|nr:type II toxin-antitoxin system HipA family toxin [Verrucomicrobiota bacterium]